MTANLPFFFDVPDFELTEDERKYFLDYEETVKDKHVNHDPINSTKHRCLQYGVVREQEIWDKVTPWFKYKPESIVLLRVDPNVDVPCHTDEARLRRSTIFTTPLIPYNDDYAVLNFHEEKNDPNIFGGKLGTGKIVASKSFSPAYVFNSTQWHSVKNTNHIKVSLQVGWETPIEEIYLMYKSGELFADGR
jgi:hypothetical protein